MLLTLLFGSCKSKQQAVQTVALHESTVVELESVEIAGDSAAIQVPFEHLSSGALTSGVTVSPNGLRLLWELRRGTLDIRAEKPPEQIHYPRTTITREVPVEVVKEIKVNRIYWWQTLLMWVGVASIISIGYRFYRVFYNKK